MVSKLDRKYIKGKIENMQKINMRQNREKDSKYLGKIDSDKRLVDNRQEVRQKIGRRRKSKYLDDNKENIVLACQKIEPILKVWKIWKERKNKIESKISHQT